MQRRTVQLTSVFICVHLWLSFLLCGCAQVAEQKREIAVVPKGVAFDFWLAVKAGAEQAGKEESATITWNGPAKETETDKQIAILENCITRRVSAIVMA